MKLNIPRNSRTPRRRIGMAKAAPPIQVRLTEDVGLLPAGFVVLVPRDEAFRLIAQRRAIAVGSLRQAAELVLTPEEFEKATA